MGAPPQQPGLNMRAGQPQQSRFASPSSQGQLLQLPPKVTVSHPRSLAPTQGHSPTQGHCLPCKSTISSQGHCLPSKGTIPPKGTISHPRSLSPTQEHYFTPRSLSPIQGHYLPPIFFYAKHGRTHTHTATCAHTGS